MAVHDTLGLDLAPGSPHYRAYVGPPSGWDVVAAMQFNLLTSLGLREYHRLLDIGCGSLRGGRLFIPYLLPGNYFGIEPAEWLVAEGIASELGQDAVRLKRPTFSGSASFELDTFGVTFDFLLAQSVFSHASQAQIASCLAAARRVMHERTLFAATFVEGDDYTGDAWTYPECVTYRRERISALAQEAGLACRVVAWPHPSSQTWVVFVDPGNDRRPGELYQSVTVVR